MKSNFSVFKVTQNHLSHPQYYLIRKEIKFFLIDNKPSCPLDNSELKKDQLIAVATCCKKAFLFNNLLKLINNNNIKPCPDCNCKIKTGKIQNISLQMQIDNLTKKVAKLEKLLTKQIN